MPQPPQHIPSSSTLSMDLPFSLRELDHALGSMHPRKAPGDDGITTALMQAVSHDPKIMARLSSLLESNNVLVPEQGGFRTREESTAQVCALMDILRRRQIADLNSHIAFIDISKAFDTVPIHALLFKLRCIGIPTITMNFLSALYSTSNARIRSGSLLSDPFPVQRGVRQGCPLSGLLFNVFINDVLDGVAPISVPGLSQEHHPRGLMFADDIAIIAPSHESLCTSMGTIADWATRWEMSFGVAKCGIMHVAPIPAPLSRLRFCQYRLTIFNGLVLGVAYYGLELIGGNSTLARRLQAPVNTGIRMILKAPLFTPIAPMLTDCGIISLDAHAILARRSKYALERTFQVWGKSKLACSYVQANHASSAKFLCSPALSTGQAIGVSLLSLARCGGLWDYPRALKAGLLHPTATDPDQLGSPSRCILCHSHLDCRPMAHLVVDCTHPTVFFARVDTQLLQAINDTRVQISGCTLHTTTTTTTPASLSLSTTSSNSSTYTIGTSVVWDNTRFEPPISVAHSEIPRQAQDTVEENPTGSRTTTTDTHTAAISSTPTPAHISYIGSDDILTVLLGGSLPGTNNAGNTEAYPGQQWLTDLNPDKIQTIRSGFGLNHHSVSRSARELPQMGGGRQVQGPNPFLASTYQGNPSPQYIAIGRAVVHSLPPPALSSLIPEILVPTVITPIQSLGVALSHTPDRHDHQDLGKFETKTRGIRHVQCSRQKNRRIQEILGRVRTPRKKRGRVTDKKLQDIRKANRPVNTKPTTLPEPSSQDIVDQPPRRQYAWASLAQPEPLPVLQGTNPAGRLMSFRNIAVGAMEASPPMEIHGGASKWTAPTLDQERNEPCSRMDMPLPQRETVPAQFKTVSDMVSLWNARSNVRSNDMDVDVNVAAPPPPAPVKYGIQSVSAMEWAHSNTQAEITSKKISSRSTEHVDPVSIAPVPSAQAVCFCRGNGPLMGGVCRNKMNIRSSFEIFQEACSQRPWQSRDVLHIACPRIVTSPTTSNRQQQYWIKCLPTGNVLIATIKQYIFMLTTK
ncbi:hypothetical protein BASA83_003011 [Batrachochytrium salamandrivorans]|nr:hypothetical protein BASA83_003011 [Batrachochytrium salamandrivorans]